MTKWEYMRFPVIADRGGPNVEALSRLGEEGWELVGFVPERQPDYTLLLGYLLFKRPNAAGQRVDPRAFSGKLTQAEWRRLYEGDWAAAEDEEHRR